MNEKDWLYRELPNSFFDEMGIIPKFRFFKIHRARKYIMKKIRGIPNYWLPLAETIINISQSKKFSEDCRTFRFQLFLIYKNLGIDLKLPHYWYIDGVTIEPETIVRVTNGVIGWRCDSSREECGITDICRFYTKENIL
jgi:hypothetical protein